MVNNNSSTNRVTKDMRKLNPGDTVVVVNTEISENGIGTVKSASNHQVVVEFNDTKKIGIYANDPNKSWFVLNEKD